MTEPKYHPVRASKYRAMIHALEEAPREDGRYNGTTEHQQELAEQMRGLFDDNDPGSDAVLLKHDETIGLADDLAAAHGHWSIGQYASALASLVKDWAGVGPREKSRS